MNPGNGIETSLETPNIRGSGATFTLMNPGNGIETLD